MARASVGPVPFKTFVSSVIFFVGPNIHQEAYAFTASSTQAPRRSFTTLRVSKQQQIVESINELFPQNNLDQRIALSRKDGYWPYISTGDEPPQEFVYGEFDVDFFAEVVEKAIGLYDGEPRIFCDLGSGTGRLVLTAAALYDWELVRGVELLPGIHQTAVEKLEACRTTTVSQAQPEPAEPSDEYLNAVPSTQESDWRQYQRFSPTDDWMNQLSQNFDDEHESTATLYVPSTTDGSSTCTISSAKEETISSGNYVLGEQQKLPLAPIELSCGSFDDPYEFYGDANIVFCFSSAMPYHVMVNMARSVGRQCCPGALIITTEYQLPAGGTIGPDQDDPNVPYGDYELELVEEMHGQNEATGGESTVFIHRLTKSLGTGNAILRPQPTVSDICYNAIQKLKQNDPQKFLRKVSNQMMFVGLPESWRPKLDDDNEAM